MTLYLFVGERQIDCMNTDQSSRQIGSTKSQGSLDLRIHKSILVIQQSILVSGTRQSILKFDVKLQIRYESLLAFSTVSRGNNFNNHMLTSLHMHENSNNNDYRMNFSSLPGICLLISIVHNCSEQLEPTGGSQEAFDCWLSAIHISMLVTSRIPRSR